MLNLIKKYEDCLVLKMSLYLMITHAPLLGEVGTGRTSLLTMA